MGEAFIAHRISTLQGTAYARNILDNSDFTNPVNQRGDTSYSGSCYNIDRWRTFLNDNVVTVQDGYIHQTGTQLLQNIEATKIDNNKVYTFAACKVDGTIRVTSGIFANAFGDSYLSCYLVSSTGVPRCTLNESDGYKWAALYDGEYTAETLPEYQPKGYAAELAECMRYYIRYYAASDMQFLVGGSNGTSLYAPFLLPTKMRVWPTLNYNNVNIYNYKSGGKVAITSMSISGGGNTNNAYAIVANHATDSSLTAQTVAAIRILSGGYIELSADL